MSDRTRPRTPCVAQVDGRPCKQFAVHGSDRCSSHLGLGGVPSKLDDDLTERLATMLRAGNYLNVALRAAGISRSTFKNWMARARSDDVADEPFRVFRDRIATARAEGEVRNVTVIARAAQNGDWRAALAMLEREFPERWGPVSVRTRDVEAPDELPEATTLDDPFSEVDELAAKRRERVV